MKIIAFKEDCECILTIRLYHIKSWVERNLTTAKISSLIKAITTIKMENQTQNIFEENQPQLVKANLIIFILSKQMQNWDSIAESKRKTY